MSSVNPYQSPIEPGQVKPPGPQFAPCPQCGNTTAKRIGFTWWGGALGPKLLTHVKCDQCGTKYNGKTGKSNLSAIVIYQLVALGLGIAIFALMRFN